MDKIKNDINMHKNEIILFHAEFFLILFLGAELMGGNTATVGK